MFRRLKRFYTTFEETVEIPECIDHDAHPTWKDIYPPRKCLTKDEVLNHVTVGATKNSSEPEDIKISYSADVEKILNKKTKLTNLDYIKISRDIYFDQGNWRNPSEQDIKFAKILCPGIDVENISIKKNPFNVDRSRLNDLNQAKGGLPDPCEMNTEPLNTSDLSQLSPKNPELSTYKWNNPWIGYDSFRPLEIHFKALEDYYRNGLHGAA
ncbi:hypothetical protein MXB_365 [Myxobolus squamalis]|nr:hypothetical protein MXB_365 [Myxobolus squamalis]